MSYQKPSHKRQVIAALSAIANCNFGLKFSSNEEGNQAAVTAINDAINKEGAVQKFINQNASPWEVVWGPVTSNSKPLGKWHTDNTMYVAKTNSFEGSAHPLYVVATSGTNAISEKGWLGEDLNVILRKKWDGDKAKGKISKGAYKGLGILLGMEHQGQSILDFFKQLDLSKKGTAYEIAVCGHSLGGAISPLVALSLKEWVNETPHKNITVGSYPSAGPSIGDERFTNYFIQTIGAENYHSIINAYDMVPHSWEPDMLKAIPNLYNNAAFGFIPALNIIKKAIPAAAALHLFDPYQRIGKDKEAIFQGQPNPENREAKKFGKEVVYQHTVSYAKYGFQWPTDVAAQIELIERHGK